MDFLSFVLQPLPDLSVQPMLGVEFLVVLPHLEVQVVVVLVGGRGQCADGLVDAHFVAHLDRNIHDVLIDREVVAVTHQNGCVLSQIGQREDCAHLAVEHTLDGVARLATDVHTTVVDNHITI